MLLEPPGAGKKEGHSASSGEYAVTGHKPRWLLEVRFQGEDILSQRQVSYDSGHQDESNLSPEALATRKSIQRLGYMAISHPMRSAKDLFREAGRRLEENSEKRKKPDREFSLLNRKLISQMVLDCYAEARKTVPGKGDGIEYIWLDEFCLADNRLSEESHGAEVDEQRNLEVGQLADIFRGATGVIVFCHRPKCDHTDIECPWGNRLFTLGEILYTPEVMQMTRCIDPEGGILSSITTFSGSEFRLKMQRRSAEAKMWHLYNIMQHSTNSGAVTWQSAIHSLVVEAIRRDEAEGFHMHNMLGKALNGLLPRRSRLEDLEGKNGWADLAWLLELNQGFYNAVLLAAVCKTADPWVGEYRWWGKPIAPRVGSERLEPLATAVPVKFKNEETDTLEPVLSIIGPRSVRLMHMPRRDAAGLHRNPVMDSLSKVVLRTLTVIFVLSVILLPVNFVAALLLLYASCIVTSIIELLVGTIYVEKQEWLALEDDSVPWGDPIRFLQNCDPDYAKLKKWGPRQLVPEWDLPQSRAKHGEQQRPYTVTLVDLKTGVYTRVGVTSRPNDMVVLAVHGSGITCMLLDRDEKALQATVSSKVGMAHVPPFVLAQAKHSGTVYIGGGALSEGPASAAPTPKGSPSSTTVPWSPDSATSLKQSWNSPLASPQSPNLLGSPLFRQQLSTSCSQSSATLLPTSTPYSRSDGVTPVQRGQASYTPVTASSPAVLAQSVESFAPLRARHINAGPASSAMAVGPYSKDYRRGAPDEFDPYQREDVEAV